MAKSALLLVVCRIFDHGKPVEPPRPEFAEEHPAHADMLRYDLAFHDPGDPSRVIFPVFHTKNGSVGGQITEARWRSYGMQVQRTDEIATSFNISGWVTYQHPHTNGAIDYTQLQSMTLSDFMVQKKYRLRSRGV